MTRQERRQALFERRPQQVIDHRRALKKSWAFLAADLRRFVKPRAKPIVKHGSPFKAWRATVRRLVHR